MKVTKFTDMSQDRIRSRDSPRYKRAAPNIDSIKAAVPNSLKGDVRDFSGDMQCSIYIRKWRVMLPGIPVK